jgi:uncharacterized Fe-S cluster-containing radical SAM superfamily protein
MHGVLKLEPENNTFNSLVVDITHRCNMECANCYIPNRNVPDMDIGQLMQFLARLPHRTYVRLIGAEPTMREDLVDIIKGVIKLGHKPSLTTNGLKLAHIEYVEQLKNAGLNMVLISMNGADDDEVYKTIDNGKYANLKTRALTNVFKANMTSINTGTIIAKGTNEHTIKRQVDLVAEIAEELGINFSQDKPWSKIIPVLRMKSVGAIGRHMGENFCYSLSELADVVAQQLGMNKEDIMYNPAISGTNLAIWFKQKDLYQNRYSKDKPTSVMFPYHTSSGTVLIRLIDWSVDEDGVPDRGNENRGRITEDWKIAPFFEHVKMNEFGY